VPARALAMVGDIGRHLAQREAKLQALLSERSRGCADMGKTPKAGSKTRTRFDVRKALADWAGADFARINGLDVTPVMKILSEIGLDPGRFANVKHFCSWLWPCPATKISGGKALSASTRRSANRVRQALKMAAMSLSRGRSAPGAFCRRPCGRTDKPRAHTAVAHQLARRAYFMLTRAAKPSPTRGSSTMKNSSYNEASPP